VAHFILEIEMDIEKAKRVIEMAGQVRAEKVKSAEDEYSLALNAFYFSVGPSDLEAESVHFTDADELNEALHGDEREDALAALYQIADARAKVATKGAA
jgi:hypothetical protein